MILLKFDFWKRDWALGYVSTLIWDSQNIFYFRKILKVLSLLTTPEATRVPSLLYQISSFVLLATNRTCTNICESSNILSPGCLIYCICVKRITICNCICSSSPSCFSASRVRIIGARLIRDFGPYHNVKNRVCCDFIILSENKFRYFK